MPEAKKVEENNQKNTTCPLNKETCNKACNKAKHYANKTKEFIKINYKKPIFIACSVIALIILLCITFCCNEQTKLHFSNHGIVKEVISGNSSKYYTCEMDRLKNREDKSKFHISCTKQIIEI